MDNKHITNISYLIGKERAYYMKQLSEGFISQELFDIEMKNLDDLLNFTMGLIDIK